MQEQYLQFISNDDLYKCLGSLYEKYKSAVNKKDLKDFLKNRIDPVRLNFDSTILNIGIEDIIEQEILRQQDKTISNAIGTFQEDLISKIKDHQKLEVGGKIDIVSENFKHIAEIKNKHNTLKGENNVDLFNKLSNYLNDEEMEGYTAYYVRIIDTDSRNEIWKFTKGGKEYSDCRIRRISGDKFYELITGDKNAFKDLLEVLPKAMNDYVSSLNPEDKIKMENSTVLVDLKEKMESDGSEDLFTELLNLNFNKYLGFK